MLNMKKHHLMNMYIITLYTIRRDLKNMNNNLFEIRKVCMTSTVFGG